MANTIIKLSQDAIDKLAGYANEITEYNDTQYRFDIGIWEDGTIDRSDLHINSNSYTRWHEAPAVSLYAHPIYTTEDIHLALQERGEDEEKIPQAELDVWGDESRTAARAWAQEIADQLTDGIESERWDAPTPYINW